MFGYQFAPRYRDIRDKMETLYGFKNPSEYDEKFLLKPIHKINTRLIIEETDNIQHILASLALKVTSQSVIIGKLSAYARKNRTKKALWELDNIYRSAYLLTYIDSVTLRHNVQRALNRGESYHKLRRVVAYAYSAAPGQNGSGTTDLERMLAAARQLRDLLQCLHSIRVGETSGTPRESGAHQSNQTRESRELEAHQLLWGIPLL